LTGRDEAPIFGAMSTLVLTDLPKDVLRGLRVRSIRNRRTPEAEALAIIEAALTPEDTRLVTGEELRRLIDEMYGPDKPKNVVDEFIAERRREARREYGEEE
jgi:plasmid stability protein